MFQVSIKGNTLAEMRDNALQIAEIFKNANIEGTKEKKAAKKSKPEGAQAKPLTTTALIAEMKTEAIANGHAIEEIKTTAQVETAPKNRNDVIALMQKIGADKGIAPSIEVLKSFGVRRLSDLGDEKMPEVYQALAKI